MLYAMRTTLRFASGQPEVAGGVGRADRILQWLYEELPVKATLGVDVALPVWQGNRYTEQAVIFDLVTYYRDAFAATADRLRIAAAVTEMPPQLQPVPGKKLTPRFEIRRVYGEAELLNLGDPTKKTSHPC
jgi:hypothetical protein